MSYYYITFRSVTYAQRGERLLMEQGIRCTVQRTPRWMEEQGCGYALRLRTGEIRRAAEALRAAGLPLRKIYVQRREGKLEELEL